MVGEVKRQMVRRRPRSWWCWCNCRCYCSLSLVCPAAGKGLSLQAVLSPRLVPVPPCTRPSPLTGPGRPLVAAGGNAVRGNQALGARRIPRLRRARGAVLSPRGHGRVHATLWGGGEMEERTSESAPAGGRTRVATERWRSRLGAGSETKGAAWSWGSWEEARR